MAGASEAAGGAGAGWTGWRAGCAGWRAAEAVGAGWAGWSAGGAGWRGGWIWWAGWCMAWTGWAPAAQAGAIGFLRSTRHTYLGRTWEKWVIKNQPTNQPLGLAVPQEPGGGEGGEDGGGQEEPARQVSTGLQLNVGILAGKIRYLNTGHLIDKEQKKDEEEEGGED